MVNREKFRHLDFIERILQQPIKTHGALEVGNNLNVHFPFENVRSYANERSQSKTAESKESSVRAIRGRVAEEILIYLLDAYFTQHKKNYIISFDSKDRVREAIKIVNKALGLEKQFDIDIVVTKEDTAKKYFLISCKGTSRERIGQFFANLFLMDDQLVERKYGGKYYLPFVEEGIEVKYGFVCYDWGKKQEFLKYTPTGKESEGLKRTEVHLINDDRYISGGVTVLNNFDNLDGVCNFEAFVGKIEQFLH